MTDLNITAADFIVIELLIFGFIFVNIYLGEMTRHIIGEKLLAGVAFGNLAFIMLLLADFELSDFWKVLIVSMIAFSGAYVAKVVKSLVEERLQPALNVLLDKVLPQLNGAANKKPAAKGKK